MVKVVGCIWYATVQKFKGNTPPDVVWIKASVGRYSEEFVGEVSAYIQVGNLKLMFVVFFVYILYDMYTQFEIYFHVIYTYSWTLCGQKA